MTAARRPGPESLADTLSAFADRLFLTGGRDPGDDALPIPAERLQVYRDLVVANYRSMLTFTFTATFRLIRAEFARGPAANGDRVREDVVRRFLAVSPARTHSTREIAARFVEFLPSEYPDLVERRPELPDLMAVERAELRAEYHSDDPGRGATAADVEAIRARSVDEFLALEVLRAPSGSLLRLSHPVVALRAGLLDGEAPPSPPAGPEVALVSRAPETLTAAVRALADPGATALERIAPGETLPLETLAERWLATSASSDGTPLDETTAFAAFGDAVLAALADGFLRLA